MDILDPLLARAAHVAGAIQSAVKRLDDIPDAENGSARKRQTLAEIAPLAAELTAITALAAVHN